MQSGDPHILAAMDGREYDEKKVDLITPTDRKEPTAFFFVIFGLVYEALATSSADSSSTTPARQLGVISALQALKCLVKPEYSGAAMMEPTIFEEFISLCYRMAMTEAAAIQIHLVEMLAIFAASQPSMAPGSDVLTLTSPRAHCLRICAHILKQSTSLSRASAARKSTLLLEQRCADHMTESQVADRIALLSTCLSAFTSIGASITSSPREDVRGVASLLYNGKYFRAHICSIRWHHFEDLLKDESSEVDLVGPTLPALKGLLDLPVGNDPEDKDRYSKLVHSLLSACLHNIDNMRSVSSWISIFQF